MSTTVDLKNYRTADFFRDCVSGLVVFLVAVPLCLGIALASGADLFSGLLSGIVGGTVVALLSGSHTSVSGPAAGLTAIVAAQIQTLGSFEAFLLAVALAGVIQIGFGIAKGGVLSSYFPSSVIKGLLVAIGVILILKQIPHVVGHDADPEGEMSFQQPDQQNTFSELLLTLGGEVHLGALVIGLLSVVFLISWNRVPALRQSLVPAPLLVVLFGTFMGLLFKPWGENWEISGLHLVQIPVPETPSELLGFLRHPDFSQLGNYAIYLGAFTIAVVASLETLLNLEAVDKLDTKKRKSPSSRELIAQGCGNLTCGLIGGLPVTSVIVRSSVNVNSGAKSKGSALVHGVLLIASVAILPVYMNMIPLSALAAILLVTGFRLASPKVFRQMWDAGRYQFIPFIVTVVAIVMTDLLYGILIGLGVAIMFILNSNLRRPVRRVLDLHLAGNLTQVDLGSQVSFLNRAAIENVLDGLSHGSRVQIDASASDYIDPDVLSLIRDFQNNVAPDRKILINLKGFSRFPAFEDVMQFPDYSTSETQLQLTQEEVLELLAEGNQRFVEDRRLNRDLIRQVRSTADGQSPVAAILSCIDSRVPAEIVFDLGVGDIFSLRVAGNVVGTKSLGSLEYAVKVAGVKVVLVLGHTRCGAVTASAEFVAAEKTVSEETGCQNLQAIVNEIKPCVDSELASDRSRFFDQTGEVVSIEEPLVDEIAERNVIRSVQEIVRRSDAIAQSVRDGEIVIRGAIYDVKTGRVEFLGDGSSSES